MAKTVLDIYNIALSLFNIEPLEEITTDGHPEVAILNLHYDGALQTCMRTRDWTFLEQELSGTTTSDVEETEDEEEGTVTDTYTVTSIYEEVTYTTVYGSSDKTTVLSSASSVTSYDLGESRGYKHSYALPYDSVGLLRVTHCGSVPYRVVGDRLLVNTEKPELWGILTTLPETGVPEDFYYYVAYTLAYMASPKLSPGDSTLQTIMQALSVYENRLLMNDVYSIREKDGAYWGLRPRRAGDVYDSHL